MRDFVRITAGLAAIIGALALIGLTAQPPAGAATSRPARIALVRSETGLALTGLAWSGDVARGELELTGEGAADLGPVTVVMASPGSVAIYGHVSVCRQWTRALGRWWCADRVMRPATASAMVTRSGQAGFCAAFARFGDAPSWRNLAAVHADARNAARASRRDYRRYESALISGRPARQLRRDLGAVYRSCGQ